MAKNKNGQLSSTSQEYLEIVDITNDMLILRDGSTAVILEVGAINFGLLSEPEQDAIIYAYAALINSLSFSAQIAIISRPKDVTTYLEYVDEQYHQAPSDLRRQQIANYRQFVANLITEQNVLDKNFYIILPLSALELGVGGAANPVGGLSPNRKPPQFDKNQVIQRSLNTLGPRRDHMVSQFSRFGLRAQQLSTKELIQLFYIMYNTQASEGIKVVDTSEYTSAVIQPQGTQSFQFPQATPAAATTPAAAPPATPPTAAPPAAPIPAPQSNPPMTAPATNGAASAIPQESASGFAPTPNAAVPPNTPPAAITPAPAQQPTGPR